MTAGRTAVARAAAASLALLVALAACTAPSSPASAPEPGTVPDDGVGVQLFQWTWDAIARECTDVLGPAGYGWLLTSPPQEHVLGEPWWTAYQPVSYRVESRLGTREEFAAMVGTCQDAGVEVLADAVVNHMTGQDTPGTGWAGTPYAHYEYPGLYSDADGDFHHCGLTANDDIVQYTDARQVQTCELVNLADLATETDHVRATVRAYLDDLLSLGVAGFRIDAAKHMAADDVAAIVADLPPGTRVLQEVIGAAGEPVQPEDYLPSGDVYDFAYGQELAGYVGGGSVGKVVELGTGTRALPTDQAVVFVDNHDTERNGSTFSYRDGEDHALAMVLMLAGTYGTPAVYSGYAFEGRDAGPPQDDDGAVLDATCAPDVGPTAAYEVGSWVCQHRWPAVVGMVGWRTAVAGAGLADVWSERRVVAFGRGDRGFLVANGGRAPAEHTFTTSLPPGTYCDVVGGAVADGGCTGLEVDVADDGTFRATLAPRSAIALHVEARP